MQFASHDTDVNGSGIASMKRSCCTSSHLPWPKECNIAIDDAISILWHWYQYNHITWLCCTSYESSCPKESNGAICFPLVWYDNTGDSNIIWTQSHDAPHFNHLELANTAVPMTMPLASHDTNANTKCITWPKYWCWTSFQLSCPSRHPHYCTRKWWYHMMPLASHDQKGHDVSLFSHINLTNAVVLLITMLESCDTDTSISCITLPIRLYCTVLIILT